MKKTPSILFREIETKDIPSLFVVRTSTHENAWSVKDLYEAGITEECVGKMLRETHKGWLCEADERVVGFAIGDRVTGEMWVIAVLPDFEGRGIGRRLMNLVVDWLWLSEHDELWLVTGNDPTLRAYGFYKELGWREAEVSEDGERVFRLSRRGQTGIPHV